MTYNFNKVYYIIYYVGNGEIINSFKKWIFCGEFEIIFIERFKEYSTQITLILPVLKLFLFRILDFICVSEYV